MTKAKQKVLFQRLLTFAQRGHRSGDANGKLVMLEHGEQPWTAADLVSQDALYALQVEFLAILLAMAREIDGGTDGATVSHLAAALPWAFKEEIAL